MPSLPNHSSPVAARRSLPIFLRRRHYVADATTQLRIAREFAIVLFVACVLVVGNYHVFETLNSLYDDGTLSYAADAWLENLLVWSYIGGTVLASVALVVLFSMFYSHRIIGPAQKINAALARLAEGDVDVFVQLRNDDYLQDVAGHVNGVSQAWRDHLADLHVAVDLLKHHLEAGAPQDVVQGVTGVEAVLARFQVSSAKPAPR